MLTVTNNHFMLSVIMPSVVMPRDIYATNNHFMVGVIMLNVTMLIVMAPFLFTFMQTF
jgi:hypothetical protein